MMPAPTTHMRAVNAVALHALRVAATEHAGTGDALRAAGVSLAVRDPLRRVYLQCAARLFVMARLARSLADVLEETATTLELGDGAGDGGACADTVADAAANADAGGSA